MTTAFFPNLEKKKSHHYKTVVFWNFFSQKLFHTIQRITKMGQQLNELQLFHQFAEEHSKSICSLLPISIL